MENERIVLPEAAFDLDFLAEVSETEQTPLEFYKVLIADDDREVHSITRVMLKDFRFDGKGISFISAFSGRDTKEILKENYDIAVILLDVVMEDNESGLKVIEFLRNELKNDKTRIILRTGQPGEAPEDRIVRDYDINDYRLKTEMTMQRLNTSLYTALRAYRDIEKNLSLSRMLEKTQEEIIFALGEVIENHFEETAGHVRRVANIMEIMAQKTGRSTEESGIIKIASTMHDIGKVAIPDAILKKPGKLTMEEFEVMKKHTEVGYRILNKSELDIFNVAAEIARYHHEKFDGTGYPVGLVGMEIPLNARLMAIVDVFDAILSKRCYKEAESIGTAVDFLKENKGRMFDPDLVELFLHHIDEIRELY